MKFSAILVIAAAVLATSSSVEAARKEDLPHTFFPMNPDAPSRQLEARVPQAVLAAKRVHEESAPRTYKPTSGDDKRRLEARVPQAVLAAKRVHEESAPRTYKPTSGDDKRRLRQGIPTAILAATEQDEPKTFFPQPTPV